LNNLAFLILIIISFFGSIWSHILEMTLRGDGFYLTKIIIYFVLTIAAFTIGKILNRDN
jgi:hypothetical protein